MDPSVITETKSEIALQVKELFSKPNSALFYQHDGVISLLTCSDKPKPKSHKIYLFCIGCGEYRKDVMEYAQKQFVFTGSCWWCRSCTLKWANLCKHDRDINFTEILAQFHHLCYYSSLKANF